MKKKLNDITIGILGGGQLGRMLVRDATNLGLHIKAIDPSNEAPIKPFIASFKQGDLTNYNDVLQFGKTCDIVTIEIENVNTDALATLEQKGVLVYPQPKIIELIKDKSKQKQFYKTNGIPTAPFTIVKNKQEVALLKKKLPFVNKLAQEGYDGRGVQVIKTEQELEKAFDAPGIVEDLIPFDKEIAVLVAQNASGEIKSYPPVELVFHPAHNLVEYLFAPASISQKLADKVEHIAIEVIEKLQLVGLLAVEMFITKDGEVLVNEVAPRPHNSGHQTIEANVTSQYEQHLRAILNLPLGDTSITTYSAMVNLLGEPGFTGKVVYKGLSEVLKLKGTHVHLYGKSETRPFRKMGHVTITDNNTEELKRKVTFVKEHLKVIA